MAEAEIAIVRIAPETSFKNKAYEALKEAILKMDISALRDFFRNFSKDRLPQDHVEEYSKANIAFHQALISLSESPVLIDMTNDILLHVRGYRQLTIGRQDRTATSLPEHMAIIEALESRDTELAEKRAREHTLGLAAYVEAHGQELL